MRASESEKSDTNQDMRAPVLRRMRFFAILLLAIAIIGLCVSLYLGGEGIWGWTQSFFESSLVGALADWFAVVALFKHPLGIPIPHTAIIPKSKSKLANQLSLFIRDNFLDPQMLLTKLALFNPAERLAQWLSSPQNIKSWSNTFREWALQGLGWFDDAKLQHVLVTTASEALEKWNASQQLGQILSFITENERHRELLDHILFKIGEFLSREELKVRISTVMIAAMEKEWPVIMGAANAVKIGPWLSDRLVSYLPKLISHIQEVLQNPEDETHQAFENSLRKLISRLEHDPILAQQLNELKHDLITSPEFQRFVKSIGKDIYTWLDQQLKEENSPLIQHIENGLSRISLKLNTDPELQDAINRNILDSAGKLVHDLRMGVTEHIAETINLWDEKKLIRELELSMGKDLQFIRYNGTLVGGIVGLGLHGLQWLIPILHNLQITI